MLELPDIAWPGADSCATPVIAGEAFEEASQSELRPFSLFFPP
jgi:hypothetical protein